MGACVVEGVGVADTPDTRLAGWGGAHLRDAEPAMRMRSPPAGSLKKGNAMLRPTSASASSRRKEPTEPAKFFANVYPGAVRGSAGPVSVTRIWLLGLLLRLPDQHGDASQRGTGSQDSPSSTTVNGAVRRRLVSDSGQLDVCRAGLCGGPRGISSIGAAAPLR